MSFTLYTAEYVGGANNHISFILAAPAPGSAGTATPSTTTGSGGASAPASAPALPTNTTTTPSTCTAYDVTGTVLAGMTFRIRASHPWPDCDPAFVPGSLKYIGCLENTKLGLWEELCRAVEPPPKQLKLNGERIDKSKEVRRCTWWAQEVTKKALAEGLVVE